jgi:hypothetical protein
MAISGIDIVKRAKTRDAFRAFPSGGASRSGCPGVRGREALGDWMARTLKAVFPSLYTDREVRLALRAVRISFSWRPCRGGVMGQDFRPEGMGRVGSRTAAAQKGLSSSGSDQAREGRLVDALAARGDEGRGTLR